MLAMPTSRFWICAGARGVLLALVLVLATTPARAGLTRTGPDIFGTVTIPAKNLAPFPKWRDSLRRYFAERARKPKPCESDWFTSCKVKEWLAFLHSVANLSPGQKMRKVNAFLNRSPYVPDIVNWGVQDYWESPYQFARRDGDCEDYAIAKFWSLRLLGFSNDRMRIVILRDLNLQIAHAILVVELNGTEYVLDNQIRDVVPASVIHHYRPIYAVNETHWWLFSPA